MRWRGSDTYAKEIYCTLFVLFTDKVLEVKNIDSKGGTQHSLSKILSEEHNSDGHLGGNSPLYLLLRSGCDFFFKHR